MFRRLDYGAVPGFAPICMDSNDPFTVECSFKKRLMRDCPEADPIELTKLAAFVTEFVKTNFRPVKKLDFEEWLEQTSYNEQRKNQLRQAKDFADRPDYATCQKVDSFVKTESYPEFKHARMINSRNDKFKCYSGPFFKAMENEVYKYHSFIKHVPVPDRPALICALDKSGGFKYATDFTAFESHFKKNIM